MHEEILSDTQKQLIPLISTLMGDFGLVGGTAIALQIGHRRSVDFDLATPKDLNQNKVRHILRDSYEIQSTLVDEPNELTVVLKDVKFTFFSFPFDITFTQKHDDTIMMPDLLTLSAMKAYALGRRSKWKDYVDLYYIFKTHSLSEVVDKAENIFKKEFNEKLFREQLAYFDDIDYTERIDYLEGFFVSDSVIQDNLKDIALQK